LFVGGELPPGLAGGLRRHLRDCASCRREASGLLQARTALSGAAARGAPDLGEAFFSALHADVVAAVAQPAGRRPGGRPQLRTRRWWGAGAAAALLFAIGLLFARPAAGLLDRAPIRPGAAGAPVNTAPGGSYLLPLEYQEGDFDAFGQGLLGRSQLRTLEQRADLWPPRRPARRAAPGASPQGGAGIRKER
jgi:hypothetical protein